MSCVCELRSLCVGRGRCAVVAGGRTCVFSSCIWRVSPCAVGRPRVSGLFGVHKSKSTALYIALV